MNNFTTETYQVKREILTYAKKLSNGVSRPSEKFIADMTYGFIASGSVLLSSIADALKEDTKKINTVDRLSRHLKQPLPESLWNNYIQTIRDDIPDDPVIMLDNSDIIKPKGRKFECMGRVKDGSADGVKIENGYWTIEATALSKEKQPISLYSHIYSQAEENFVSQNTHTFHAIDASLAALMGKGTGTFVCDRGYDANNMFTYFYKKNQHFIIRLTKQRKLFFKGKWYKASTLANARKGKFKTILRFRSGEKECYVSVLNVQITQSKKPLRLVMVYGLSEMPMMLATNRPILGKKDAIDICRTYLSRWRIEEYFRFKKQYFGFENFRIRTLCAIQNLNRLLTCCIPFLNRIKAKPQSSKLRNAIYKKARSIKAQVLFDYYRISKGISFILAKARSGIRDWYKPLRIRDPQLCFLC